MFTSICSVTPTLCRRDVTILPCLFLTKPAGCTAGPREPIQHLKSFLIPLIVRHRASGEAADRPKPHPARLFWGPRMTQRYRDLPDRNSKPELLTDSVTHSRESQPACSPDLTLPHIYNTLHQHRSIVGTADATPPPGNTKLRRAFLIL